MQVLYGEGLVSHTGPESCVVSRKGAIEALTGGVWAGLLSRENGLSQGADDFPPSEGNIGRDVDDGFPSGPAWSLEPWHVHKLSGREPYPGTTCCVGTPAQARHCVLTATA